MRRAGTLAVVVAMVVAVPAAALAGGGGQQAGACPGFSQGARIAMLDGCFDGVAHFAAAGEALTIVNTGHAQHNYVAVDGAFDTGWIQPGEQAELRDVAAGVYRVFCTLHGSRTGEGMAGVLIVGDPSVTDAAAVVAPPPATPAVGGDEIVAALDRQTEALAAIGDRQTALLDGLQPADAGPPDWAWQVTILIALAAGAAVVALSVRRRSPRPAPTQVVGSEMA